LAWYRAPKNTPTEIVDKLKNEINAAIANPRIKARFAELGNMVLPTSPADFEKLIAEEQKWQGHPRSQHQGGLSLRVACEAKKLRHSQPCS
jgi:hypothetical protein